jgi:glycosyltransferase involved in cell wall biosynthesis
MDLDLKRFIMSEESVTIITPTYNHEDYIGQCIESVLSQTYTHWEQIIVDDGSSDRTAEIIAQYSDPRIRYVHQSNVGIWRLKETYNTALKQAQGDLIAILEGDDFWPPDKLEKQILAFEHDDVVLSCGIGAQVDSKGIVLGRLPGNTKYLSSLSEESTLRELILGNFIIACTVMCRKETLQSIGGFQQASYTPFVDYPTWLELCLQGKVVMLDETVGYWRRHDKQVTNQLPVDMANGRRYSIDFFKKLPDDLREKLDIDFLDLECSYRCGLGNSWISSGRNALIKQHWGQARSDFYEAFKLGTPFIKLKAFGGLICSVCKIDAEWIAKYFKK